MCGKYFVFVPILLIVFSGWTGGPFVKGEGKNPKSDSLSLKNEDICPCLPMDKCPRVYGQSATDIRELGFLEPCSEYGTVRCCGVTIRIQHEKDDERELWKGERPLMDQGTNSLVDSDLRSAESSINSVTLPPTQGENDPSIPPAPKPYKVRRRKVIKVRRPVGNPNNNSTTGKVGTTGLLSEGVYEKKSNSIKFPRPQRPVGVFLSSSGHPKKVGLMEENNSTGTSVEEVPNVANSTLTTPIKMTTRINPVFSKIRKPVLKLGLKVESSLPGKIIEIKRGDEPNAGEQEATDSKKTVLNAGITIRKRPLKSSSTPAPNIPLENIQPISTAPSTSLDTLKRRVPLVGRRKPAIVSPVESVTTSFNDNNSNQVEQISLSMSQGNVNPSPSPVVPAIRIRRPMKQGFRRIQKQEVAEVLPEFIQTEISTTTVEPSSIAPIIPELLQEPVVPVTEETPIPSSSFRPKYRLRYRTTTTTTTTPEPLATTPEEIMPITESRIPEYLEPTIDEPEYKVPVPPSTTPVEEISLSFGSFSDEKPIKIQTEPIKIQAEPIYEHEEPTTTTTTTTSTTTTTTTTTTSTTTPPPPPSTEEPQPEPEPEYIPEKEPEVQEEKVYEPERSYERKQPQRYSQVERINAYARPRIQPQPTYEPKKPEPSQSSHRFSLTSLSDIFKPTSHEIKPKEPTRRPVETQPYEIKQKEPTRRPVETQTTENAESYDLVLDKEARQSMKYNKPIYQEFEENYDDEEFEEESRVSVSVSPDVDTSQTPAPKKPRTKYRRIQKPALLETSTSTNSPVEYVNSNPVLESRANVLSSPESILSKQRPQQKQYESTPDMKANFVFPPYRQSIGTRIYAKPVTTTTTTTPPPPPPTTSTLPPSPPPTTEYQVVYVPSSSTTEKVSSTPSYYHNYYLMGNAPNHGIYSNAQQTDAPSFQTQIKPTEAPTTSTTSAYIPPSTPSTNPPRKYKTSSRFTVPKKFNFGELENSGHDSLFQTASKPITESSELVKFPTESPAEVPIEYNNYKQNIVNPTTSTSSLPTSTNSPLPSNPDLEVFKVKINGIPTEVLIHENLSVPAKVTSYAYNETEEEKNPQNTESQLGLRNPIIPYQSKPITSVNMNNHVSGLPVPSVPASTQPSHLPVQLQYQNPSLRQTTNPIVPILLPTPTLTLSRPQEDRPPVVSTQKQPSQLSPSSLNQFETNQGHLSPQFLPPKQEYYHIQTPPKVLYSPEQNPSSQQYRPTMQSSPPHPQIQYKAPPPQPHISIPSTQPENHYRPAHQQQYAPAPPPQSHISNAPPQLSPAPSAQRPYAPIPPPQYHSSIPKPVQQQQQFVPPPQPQQPPRHMQQQYSPPQQTKILIQGPPQPQQPSNNPAQYNPQKSGPQIKYSSNQFNPYDPLGRPISFPPGTPHYIKEYHDHHAISHSILSKLKNTVRTSRATNLTEADLDYIFELAKEGRSDEEMQSLVGPLLRNLDFLEDGSESKESQNSTLSSPNGDSEKALTLLNSTIQEETTKSNHTVHESMKIDEDAIEEQDKSGFKPPEIQRGFLPLVPYSDTDPGPTLVSLSNFPVSSPRVSRGLPLEKLIVSLTSNDKENDTKTN